MCKTCLEYFNLFTKSPVPRRCSQLHEHGKYVFDDTMSFWNSSLRVRVFIGLRLVLRLVVGLFLSIIAKIKWLHVSLTVAWKPTNTCIECIQLNQFRLSLTNLKRPKPDAKSTMRMTNFNSYLCKKFHLDTAKTWDWKL